TSDTSPARMGSVSHEHRRTRARSLDAASALPRPATGTAEEVDDRAHMLRNDYLRTRPAPRRHCHIHTYDLRSLPPSAPIRATGPAPEQYRHRSLARPRPDTAARDSGVGVASPGEPVDGSAVDGSALRPEAIVRLPLDRGIPRR